mmetsp:Transcript_41521/g.62752  ORF Transcript_41521/g.62752 Transcript_41521/m.62752 type:complete len:160 (-) Transcript_41521:260-739(-)
MAPKEVVDQESESGMGIVYVREKILEELKTKVKSGAEISKELVEKLTDDEEIDLQEMMVPIDMGNNEEDLEDLLENKGAKVVAEMFIKAQETFEKSKASMPEEDIPKPMTAEELASRLGPDFMEEGEEEEMMFDEDAEEDDDDDDDDEDEPPTKKAKKA